MNKKFTQSYNPLYFLAALGNGGIAVSFFMYLMFMTKHPNTPIPIFENISATITGTNKILAVLTVISMIGIIFFVVNHIRTLIWNIREYRKFRHTDEFTEIKNSNGEVNLMAIPLTLGMTVNTLFIVGAVFVPGLWNVVEYIFPFALTAFILIGIYALKIFLEYYSRILVKGNFSFDNNNNLSQLISSFAFAMIGVGLAAPGAMSHNLATSVVGIVGAVFFTTISILLLGIHLVLGLKSIYRKGINKETSPSLWIVIPIMTLYGITFVRVFSGVFHNILKLAPPPVVVFLILGMLVSIQAIIALIGYRVLSKVKYFDEYIYGDNAHVGSYALICPGVAGFVLGMFFIHWGFVKNSIISSFSPIYFIMIIPLVFLQIKTIITLVKVNSKHICKDEECLNRKDKNFKMVGES